MSNTITCVVFRGPVELARETRQGFRVGKRLSVWAAGNQRAIDKLAANVYVADDPATHATRAVIIDDASEKETDRFTIVAGLSQHDGYGEL
jgi:hypothetical protein